jgi:hypothetical protein
MKWEPIQRIRAIGQHPQIWRWLLVLILLSAFALRLHRLGDSSVTWDEGWSVWSARQSLTEILQLTVPDAQSTVYLWLLHAWRGIGGDGEWALRALSALLGTLTVAVTYQLGRAVVGRRAGLLGALFLALSRFHIVWSQEISPLALTGLVIVLGAWAGWRVWRWGKASGQNGGVMGQGRWQRPLTLALGVVIVVVTAVGMRGYYASRILHDDYKSLADALRAYVHSGDAVLLGTEQEWPVFAYHYSDEWINLAQLTPNMLADLWARSEGLWLVENGLETAVAQTNTQAWLEEHAVAQRELDFGDTLLRFYARTPERVETINVVVEGVQPERELFSVVKTGMHFVGYDLPSRTYCPGDTVHMGFYFYRNWRVADESHSMEIGLTDRTGYGWDYNLTRITPDDVTSEEGLVRKEVTFTIPLEAPAGPYSIYIYNCGGDLGHFAHFTVQ